jgi:hypothetical protein
MYSKRLVLEVTYRSVAQWQVPLEPVSMYRYEGLGALRLVRIVVEDVNNRLPGRRKLAR